MFVHPDTGELRTPLEEYKAMLDAEAARRNTPVAKAIRAFSEQYQEPKVFWTWELEAKAAFSREIAPMIRAFVQEHPDKADWPFNSYMKIASEFDYGLPGEGVISQEQALALARVALVQEYGLSEDQAKIIADHPVNVFFVNLFYDVTNPDKPLWKVFYSSPSIYVQDQGLFALIKKHTGGRYPQLQGGAGRQNGRGCPCIYNAVQPKHRGRDESHSVNHPPHTTRLPCSAAFFTYRML